MDKEYREMRLTKFHFFKGLIFGIISAVLLISCLLESPKAYIAVIILFTFMLIYSVYCCLEQANWYIRYDAEGFEVRSVLRRVSRYSYKDVKYIKPLKKNAAIIAIKNSHKQYEIEPRIQGAEDFFDTFRSYSIKAPESQK